MNETTISDPGAINQPASLECDANQAIGRVNCSVSAFVSRARGNNNKARGIESRVKEESRGAGGPTRFRMTCRFPPGLRRLTTHAQSSEHEFNAKEEKSGPCREDYWLYFRAEEARVFCVLLIAQRSAVSVFGARSPLVLAFFNAALSQWRILSVQRDDGVTRILLMIIALARPRFCSVPFFF